MRRAELVAEVRRLADETAGLAAEVRCGDVAVGLLGQVRDFGHRLPPGLAAEIRRVVDDMVATRHEAHGEPSCSPRSGTSSAGGDGPSPVAPSTETRQAAQDGQSGSGGGAMDGVPAHQPTPQLRDVWESHFDDLFTVTGLANGMVGLGDGSSVSPTTMRKHWRLVERDGKPWPPAQEPERPRPGEKWRSNQDGSVLTVESVTRGTVWFVEYPLPEDLTLFMHHCRRIAEAPAQEPEPVAVEVTPRKGEVWQDDGGLRVRLHRPALATGAPRREWVWIAEVVESGWRGMREVGDTITDVELDRDGWTLIEVTPDVQCPKCEGNGDIVHTPGDPGIVCDACDGSGEQEPAREAGVEPATDEQIAELVDCHVEFYWAGGEAIRPLVARVRQEQGQATEFLNGRTRWQGRAQIAEGQVQRLIGERDEAVDRTYAAVDRANAAEAALARVERVTDLERDVVQAAQAHTAANVPTTWHLLRDAVRALRDAQEEGQ